MTLTEFKQIVLPLLNNERYFEQRAVDQLTSFPAENQNAQADILKAHTEKLEKMQNALRFLENLKQ